jgi:pimeloyl-ACP methyl ester carboxylesterase
VSPAPLFARLETSSWELAHRLAEGALLRAKITARRFATAHGSLRVLDVGGPPDEPPLVLLHGYGASALGLLPLALSLDGTRRCLLVDLYDFAGDSRRTFSPFGMHPLRVAEHARSVVEMLEVAGVETYDLYGVSLGAWIALHVAVLARAPRRMLLVCPLGTRGDVAELRALARRAEEEGLASVAPRFVATPPLGRISLAGTLTRGMLRVAASMGRTREFARALDDADAVDGLLAGIRAEVRILAAEHDRLVGPAGAQAILDGLPCASGAWALGSSHGLPVESPGLVTLALRDLLRAPDDVAEAPGRWARARLHVGTLPKLRPMVRS